MNEYKDARRRAGLCPKEGHGPAVAWGMCEPCARRHARYHGWADALAAALPAEVAR